jgi:HAD superfamily hydrolase (TIGR01509 family)
LFRLCCAFCQVDANLVAAGFSVSDFDAVVAADKFEAIKPAPDIFLAAAGLMGTPPEQCVVVEDAAAGVQAAKNAGGLLRGDILPLGG